ncbi:SCO family protein [Malonomonas rubra]|uniref:SCO family protein n=1 Tax=Malonomonas rubra TaxID=57040 RepID=UPI0026F1448E|nr:SCO family protein [Malonomonas rubra]
MKTKAILSLLAIIAITALLYFLTLDEERYHRTQVDYPIPPVTLLDEHGQPVVLRDFLLVDKPVMLEFLFTSCTTLCPNQAVQFANFQKKLPNSEQVRLVSITVDPETDTPAVLNHYLHQYQALPGWDFLTGSKSDIKQVMTAFNIKPSDMITHDSSLLLRHPKTGQWTRIDGQLSSQDFIHEHQLLLQ